MRKKFEDILDIINGKSQKRVENPNGIYPIYGSGGVMGYADDYLCDANTVVIGRKGSINNPIYVEEPFWNVDTAFGLVARKNVLLPRYLYFFCVHYDFDKLNTTVTIPSLTRANLLKIEMDVPNIDEQKKIVDKLDCMVKLIQLQKRQIEQLDTLVKSRFVEMFGDPIINSKSLPIISLGELSELITKGASPSWQGFSYTEDSTQTLFITSENVRSGFLDLSSPKYVENRFNDKQRRSVLKRGDFLINIVGASIGRAAQFNLECKANINQATALVRIKDNLINHSYLLVYLNSEKALQMYDFMKSDTGRANLSLQDIGNLSVLLPTMKKQLEFAAFVHQVDQLKSQTQKSLDKTQLLFNSLMQQYFG